MNGFDRIKPRRKGYTYDQDKIVRPEQTVATALERIKKYEEKHGYKLINGPLKINNVFDIPQYKIFCSQKLNTIYPMMRGTQGKGASDIQAQASCVMEFIERFSFNEYKGWVYKSYNDFPAGESALQFEHIAMSLNYGGEDVKELIEEFKSVPFSWGRGYNLTTGREEYIPRFFYEMCTTGLASGNEVEEALLQAICECVERHSGAYIQWFGGEYPTIDRKSIKNDVIQGLFDKVDKAGAGLLLKDFSSILGIPVIGVITIDDKNRDNIGFGIGVCTDKDKALIRSLLESAQALPGFSPATSLKNTTGSFYYDSYDEMKFLLKGEVVDFGAVIDLSENDIRQEIIKCTDILSKKDKEVIFIDATHDEIGFGVVVAHLKNAYPIFLAVSMPYQLALCQLHNDDLDSAIKNLKKAEKLEKDKTLVFYNIGRYYHRKGEYRKAIEYYTAAIGIHPLYTSAPLRNIDLPLGECFFMLGEYDKALTALNTAKAVEKDNSEIYYNLGRCRSARGEYSESLKNFEKALELAGSEDERSGIYFEIGNVKKLLGDLAGAERALKESIRLNPGAKNAAGYNLLGAVYIDEGKNGDAVEALKQAVKYSPDTWENYNMLGVGYRNMGDKNAAVAALEKAILLNPKEWSNYNIAGRILKDTGQDARSREMLKKAWELCGDPVYRKKIEEFLGTMSEK